MYTTNIIDSLNNVSRKALFRSLQSTFEQSDYREAALNTFLIKASGVSFFNIASAFWGITIGLGTLAISRFART